MGCSQIISSFLMLVLIKWSVWHVQLLQHEHQEIMRAMDILVFKVNVFHDLEKLFLTFFEKQFEYDDQGISFHGLPLIHIDEDKWRIFYVKKELIAGEKSRSKQIRLNQCQDWTNREVFIFNEDAGQKNTVLACEGQLLTLQFPLHFEKKRLYVTPIQYKTYAFRYKEGLYQVYLNHQDSQHLLDLNNKPQLIINMGKQQGIELQIGGKRWHVLKNGVFQALSG